VEIRRFERHYDYAQWSWQGGEVRDASRVDLIDNACRVPFPYGHSHPYDLIADRDGELTRIQVKTAKTRSGANQYFIDIHDPSKYDPEDVDLFAAYPDDEPHAFYVTYSEIMPNGRASVTYTPPEDMGAQVNVDRANLARDFTFEAAKKKLQR